MERRQQRTNLGPVHTTNDSPQSLGVAINVADLERQTSAGLLPTVDARAGVFDVAELERRDSGSGFSGGGAATVTAVRAGAFDVSALESGAVADALPV